MAKYEKYMMCNFGYHHPIFGLQSLVLVDIMQRDSNINYDVCSHCGKPLKKTIYVFVTEKENLEYLFGSECVKHVIQAGLVR